MAFEYPLTMDTPLKSQKKNYWSALIYLSLTIGTLATAACGDSSSKKHADPPTAICITGGINQPDGNCTHQQGLTPGYVPYPVAPNNLYVGAPTFENGICNCPAGSYPVYSEAYGLGCVQQNLFDPHLTAYRAYPWQTQTQNFGDYTTSTALLNGSANNLTATTPIINFFTNSVACHQGALELCDDRIEDACGVGGYCKLIGGAGYMGTCVQTHKVIQSE